jgi:hypothetical protein
VKFDCPDPLDRRRGVAAQRRERRPGPGGVRLHAVVAEPSSDRHGLAQGSLSFVEPARVGQCIGEERRRRRALQPGTGQERKGHLHPLDRLVEVAARERDSVAERDQCSRFPFDFTGKPAQRRRLTQPSFGADHRGRVSPPGLDPRERRQRSRAHGALATDARRNHCLGFGRDLVARLRHRAGHQQLGLDLALLTRFEDQTQRALEQLALQLEIGFLLGDPRHLHERERVRREPVCGKRGQIARNSARSSAPSSCQRRPAISAATPW